VALRTDRRRLSGTQGFESDDLGDVTTAVNVRLSRAVTCLAPVLIPFQKRGVWRSCKVFIPNLLVTGLADVSFGVLSGRRTGQSLRSLRRVRGGLSLDCSRQEHWQQATHDPYCEILRVDAHLSPNNLANRGVRTVRRQRKTEMAANVKFVANSIKNLRPSQRYRAELNAQRDSWRKVPRYKRQLAVQRLLTQLPSHKF
jgi:hypothetical protein